MTELRTTKERGFTEGNGMEVEMEDWGLAEKKDFLRRVAVEAG